MGKEPKRIIAERGRLVNRGFEIRSVRESEGYERRRW